MTAAKLSEFVAQPAPAAATAVLSGVGVDAAGTPAHHPPVGVAVDAASRRQDQPAAPVRLAGLAPASTLHLAVLSYLNRGRPGQPRLWRHT